VRSGGRDFEVKIGTITCTLCEASYETKIHLLSEPIDVYSDWVDECERLNYGDAADDRD